MPARLTALVAIALVLSACGVRKDLHQAALDAIAEDQDRIAAMTAEVDACNTAVAGLDQALEQCKGEVAVLQGARDEVLADNTALRAQLRELGADLDELSEAQSTLSTMLSDAERALEEARERQAAADARDAIYRRLKDSLQAMIDAGKLDVRIARGRMVIDLKQDILFASGEAKVSEIGIDTLKAVAIALAEFDERQFQVEGHTDNIPIKTSRFPSNWELSTARAVAVVKLFIDAGMNPDNLSAAGFGEFQPRADNASDEGRALNRRIEVVMVPDLQLLPDLVDSL
ncbi:MAG: OmpA family protein [Proteobacteria bacterium]|nr:OmpA family protein [Pseudomonadota bacterium]